CLAEWKVIFLCVPECNTHLANSLLLVALYFKFLKTLSCGSHRFPNKSRACLEIYKYSTPSVFSCLKFTLYTSSPSSRTSDHVSLLQSDHLSPERQAKINADFKTGYLHGVSDNFCNSSNVRYSRCVSTISKLLRSSAKL